MAVEIERILFTVDKYEKMIEAGILGEDDHVELIRGEIVKMTPIGLRHAACVARLVKLFEKKVGDVALVWPQNPVLVGGHSMPEPDVTLLKPAADFYTSARPTAQDVLLLVEVADSSVARDKAMKVPLYAEAGVEELWIVNLVKNVIEVYSDPIGNTYRQVRRARRGDTLPLLDQPGISVTVSEVLG
jgi:Uma2 family endonuclease